MSSVSSYVTVPEDVEPTLRRFQEMIAKYQFMDANVRKRAEGLRQKLPEMEDTLSTIRYLRKKKAFLMDQQAKEKSHGEAEDENERKQSELETTFSLADTLYAKAKILPQEIEEVYLWLGANVMVAYPLEEAEEMLSGRAEKAKETLKACEEDIEFLRVQITTVEVATARVYNWDVVEKRKRGQNAPDKERDEEEDEDTSIKGG